MYLFLHIRIDFPEHKLQIEKKENFRELFCELDVLTIVFHWLLNKWDLFRSLRHLLIIHNYISVDNRNLTRMWEIKVGKRNARKLHIKYLHTIWPP